MSTGHAALLLLLLLSAAASSSASNQARSLFQYEGKDDDPPAPPPPAAAAAASSSSNSAAATAPNITQLAIEVQKQIREPAAQIINLNTEFSSGGSSISVGEADEADRLMVQFKFAACSGVQLHHHSNVELMQAIVGSLSVGIIEPRGTLTPYNFSAGSAVVIPSGWMHYYLNVGCDTAILAATWPAGTKTTFTLNALSAIPPALMSRLFGTTGTVPTVKPGYPLIKDPDCLKRCGLGNSSAAAQGH